MIFGLGMVYLCWPLLLQGQLITIGFGVAFGTLGVAVVFAGIAILRGASIKDILLMLHLPS